MVNQLAQEKNDLVKHRDMLHAQVAQLQQQHADLTATVQKLEVERQAGGSELAIVKGELEDLVVRNEEQLKRKEQLDRELKESRQAMEALQNEINARKDEKNRNAEAIAQLDGQLTAEKTRSDQLRNRNDSLEVRKHMCDQERLKERASLAKTSNERLDLQTQLKDRQDLINSLKGGKAKLTKQFEALKAKKAAGDAATAKLEACRNELKSEIASLQKEEEQLKRQAESDSKQIGDLLHERDILTKSVVKGDELSKQQVELVLRHKGQANTLEKDVKRWKRELSLKLHRWHELEKQREKYESELDLAKGRHETACDDLRNRENHMTKLKKSIADVKRRLGQQKSLYESVRTDKNMYSKNLEDSEKELDEMRRRFKAMNLEMYQLREMIKERDDEVIKTHNDNNEVQKDMERISESLKRHKNLEKRSQEKVAEQQDEIKKLEATILEAEAEQKNQHKDYEAVGSERKILSTQLINRNEELALLYEKIKIQESTLKKGAVQYQSRLDEIKTQKEEIASLKADLYKVQQQAENINDLKAEVYHHQRELLQERTKVKALSEELENPMNVHRWRKLEGSDRSMFELIQKVRTLQDRLIAKTELCVKKDKVLQEKEKAQKDLTSVLQKQPGPEIEEELERSRDSLAAKNKQMTAMKSELQTYQSLVGDYKDEMERLTRELQDTKKKFFDQKKKEQTFSASHTAETRVIHPKPAAQVRFTGGGFNLAH